MKNIAMHTLAMIKNQKAYNYAIRRQEFLENLRNELLFLISTTHEKIQTDTRYDFQKMTIGEYSSFELLKFASDFGFTFSQDENTLSIIIIPHDKGKENSILEGVMIEVNEELHGYTQEMLSQARSICTEIAESLQSLNYICVQASEDSYYLIVEVKYLPFDSICNEEIIRIGKEEWHFHDVTVDEEEKKVYLLLEDKN